MSLVLQSLLPCPNSCQGTSPHQQGWDTKMAMLSFCGIDVSKDRLDVVVLPEGWFFSVSNDTAGWAELVARLRPLTYSIDEDMVANMTCTCPPSRSTSAGPAPRYGTSARLTPVIILNSSPAI